MSEREEHPLSWEDWRSLRINQTSSEGHFQSIGVGSTEYLLRGTVSPSHQQGAFPAPRNNPNRSLTAMTALTLRWYPINSAAHLYADVDEGDSHRHVREHREHQ